MFDFFWNTYMKTYVLCITYLTHILIYKILSFAIYFKKLS
jgi:hypothetical protein